MAHILLIEPDIKLARTYKTALVGDRHSVEVCTMAQDAILQADKQCPDVVLLELQLATHGGVEFLYEFRSYADWREVPVVIISHVPPAELAASSDLLMRRLGVQAYYYKPQLSLRTLLSVVRRTLPETVDMAEKAEKAKK